MHVARSVGADQLVELLDGLVAEHGAPAFVRCDNGPELTSHALRDWGRQPGAQMALIEPGSPWQNRSSSPSTPVARGELLNVELFACLAEAGVVIEDWREDHNHGRRHSALRRKTPTRSPLPGQHRRQPRRSARHPASSHDERVRPAAPTVRSSTCI